jgi:capsular exopolysaccharide synthesis family protein
MNQERDDRDEAEIDLGHYLLVLSRRRWIVIAAFVVCVLSAALYAFTARPVYRATALILIEKERRDPNYNEGMMVETSADDYYQTQYRLLKSKSLIKKVYAKLGLSDSEEFGNGPDSLRDSVSISPVRRSRLVHVSADSFSPALAEKIANSVSTTYVEQNVESKLFISKEILQALFKSEEAAKSAGGTAPSLTYDSLPAVVNSPLIQNLKTQLANLEAKEGDLSRRYTLEHPERSRLRSQMKALRDRVDGETKKIVAGMKAELSGRLLGNNVRVIDPAETPKYPFKPRKKRTLVVAALLGLMLGSLLALGVDMLDQTLHTQEDVERKLRLPFLGSVPHVQFEGDDAASYSKLISGPKSFSGEALKNIRTMLGFAAAGKDMKTVLITSTGQGEGKTFIAISLAMVFSQLKERVLLIEGDLRRPNLHKRFGLSREKGLSHYLAHGEGPEEAKFLIQESGVENLDVLVSGHIPPNPSELLSTPRMPALVAWAREHYDRVIIDGTPIFPITDALLWSDRIDAAAFVVKFGATNAKLAERALQKLRDSRVNIAGAIVNQVTAKANSYGDYYYYYYYYSDYVKNPDQNPKEA